jgi:ribosomal-protein-alanine N-acetyltransferase
MEGVCFDEPWKSISPDAVCIVEEYGYVVGNGQELHRIGILPEFRRQGLAFSLVQRFLEKCEGEVFLEVAAKNTGAVKLYEKCGFVEIARRKNYYKADDCIVMRKN